jgi:hypothetical protein
MGSSIYDVTRNFRYVRSDPTAHLFIKPHRLCVTFLPCRWACLNCHLYQILGAFAKLRKAAISFVMSARLSVRMEHLGSHWTEFNEI